MDRPPFPCDLILVFPHSESETSYTNCTASSHGAAMRHPVPVVGTEQNASLRNRLFMHTWAGSGVFPRNDNASGRDVPEHTPAPVAGLEDAGGRFSSPQRPYSIASNAPPPYEHIYIPEVDLENFEDYADGDYHPTVVGDHFHNGRYEVVHKLGFGGYSTIWLARDKHTQRLRSGDSTHIGRQFVPRLLDEFTFDGPNGHHTCLVQDPEGCSIAESKEDSVNFMFPTESARSIAAQLIMRVSYLHSHGICHTRNFLLRGPNLDSLSPDELYSRYRLDKAPITRVDGAAVEPRAPPYAVYPIYMKMHADKLVDPIVRISDYGTSFVVATEHSPKLHTPPLYIPPEDFFNQPITQAADIWTLAISLYEVLSERPLFETYAWDRDDIVAEMVSTLGMPPARWWDAWEIRKEFFEEDGSWVRNIKRARMASFRPLHQCLWDMGRGETSEACQWDVEGGEMRALEELLRGMMTFEPTEKLTAEQLMRSEYMVNWAMPAWERQLETSRESVFQ
ncbi:hypothetical protein V495_04012 [Pseudogymnoascus sp. VKM F-4514 (FW-929)]|nr:hypothetical protein V495_04012 [Pseudogymnoascus sp. VKM F-4514 (FW-929)]KFY54307.1 hypothetical protein V497_07800 [Pseudogymnoascus sp. VKM F-4516 (FW-969)]